MTFEVVEAKRHFLYSELCLSLTLKNTLSTMVVAKQVKQCLPSLPSPFQLYKLIE